MIIKADTSRWKTLWILAVSISLPPPEPDSALNIIKLAQEKNLPYTQVIKPGVIIGPLHLSIALVTAYRRHSRGKGVAKAPFMELLLRLAGEKQVSKALDKIGIKPGSLHACLVAVSSSREKIGMLVDDPLISRLKTGECRWGGAEAATLYNYNPGSCFSNAERCAEIHAASMAAMLELL